MVRETVAIASDHAGVALKAALSRALEEKGYSVLDLGAHGPESVDYPDFADALAAALAEGKATRGVAVCGTGIGISIALNRHRHIRAALCHDGSSARLAREHNDANVIAIGARQHTFEQVTEFIDTFIATPFSGEERHVRRIRQLAAFEADGTLEPDPRAGSVTTDVLAATDSSFDPEAG